MRRRNYLRGMAVTRAGNYLIYPIRMASNYGAGPALSLWSWPVQDVGLCKEHTRALSSNRRVIDGLGLRWLQGWRWR